MSSFLTMNKANYAEHAIAKQIVLLFDRNAMFILKTLLGLRVLGEKF